MADYRSMFDSEYLRAVDLEDADAVFIIASVEAGEVGEEGKKQPIITFEGQEKKFGCNRTNAVTIANLYGNDTRQWKGKALTLFPTTTQFKGDTVDCIRVRPEIPRGARRSPLRSSKPAPAAKKGARR